MAKKYKHILNTFRLKISIFFCSIFLVLPIVVFFAYHLAFFDRIYPGVYISQIPIGNMTMSEAETVLASYFNSHPLASLTLINKSQSWVLPLTELGISPNIHETVKNAFLIGRTGSFQQQLSSKWQSFFYGQRVPIEYVFSTDLLDAKIASINSTVSVPLVEPQITINELTALSPSRVIVSQGISGLALDTKLLRKEILKHLSTYDQNSIELPINILSVSIKEDDLERTRLRAETLLTKSFVLTSSDFSQELSSKAIISFLQFTGGYDKEKVRQYISGLSDSVNKPPENAAFTFENGRVTVFKPAKDGISIQLDQAVTGILSKLIDLESTTSSSLTYTLPITSAKPAITTESVNSLGIKELIGKGQSSFKGSIAGRIHNVILASSKLNGVLIAPNEIFSFNKTIGDVSANTGFQQAYIIKEGRTVLGDGGGVCQVSTTLFRAVLNAGLPIDERWAHAYRVSYYEQDMGPGLDATVYDPSNDLKFTNNTSSHILIQTHVDTNTFSLVYELYGTSDGRKAEISKPKIWSESPPPPDLYQDDPTLPTGQTKQVDWKAWGAKVSFDYKVTRNGETLIEKSFYSNYKPWQSVFLKGTKT